MARQSEERGVGGLSGVLDQLPTDELKEQTKDLMTAMGERAMVMATDKVGDLTDRLLDYAGGGGWHGFGGKDDGGGSNGHGLPMKLLGVGAAGLKQMVTNKLGGGGGRGGAGGGKKLKLTNIVEQIDVGVPVRVAYNQWTQFQDFPRFTKRLDRVEQQDEMKLTWKAGIFLSHRTWESTIVEQVADEMIVWRSKGEKGHVDGTVTFHEIAPNLTRILLVLEYHPQGLFERTGNIWRAQGRRVRLELKHFRRQVMTRTILDPDGVEGWRGEIRDGEVVKSHEDAMEEEEENAEEGPEDEYEDEGTDEEDREDEDRAGEDSDEEGEDAYQEEPEAEDHDDRYDEDEDRYDEGEGEGEDRGESEDEDRYDEYDDEEEDRGDEEEAPEDEYEEDWEDEYEDEPEDEDESTDEYDEEAERAPSRGRRRAPAMSR
ncbi:SRPBCC family protein [Kitasatospora sp. NPDC004240]